MAIWTPEADQFIADCADRGLSANITASMLGGGRTRNAVIGRAHRIGVEFRSGNNAWSREPKPRGKYKERVKKERPPKVTKPKKHRNGFAFGSGFTKVPDSMKTPPVPVVAAPPPDNMPTTFVAGAAGAIDALKLRECRWPIGDPQRIDFRFCLARTARDYSYCSHHHSYAHAGGNYAKADDDEET